MNFLKKSLYNNGLIYNRNNNYSLFSINRLFNNNSTIVSPLNLANEFFTKRESKKKLQKMSMKKQNSNDRVKGSKKNQNEKPQKKEHTLKKHRKINMELERIEKLTNEENDNKNKNKNKYNKKDKSDNKKKNLLNNNVNNKITTRKYMPPPLTVPDSFISRKSEEELKKEDAVNKVNLLLEKDEAVPSEHKRVKYYVTRDMEGMRVDRWISHKLPILPHSLVCKWLRNKIIYKENEEFKQNSTSELKRHKMKFNDKVEVGSWIYFPSQALLDQHMADINEPTKYTRLSDDEIKEIKESVLYKDEHLLVLNKPQGLSVQGGSGLKKHLDMMLNHLRFEKSENPKLVHRLDKATSGILILGRSRLAATAMAEKFELKLVSSKKKEKEKFNKDNERENKKNSSKKKKDTKDEEIDDDEDLENKGIKKTYWALIAGAPKPREGRIRAPLKKVMIGGEEKVIPALKIGDGAKLAITEYKVIQSSLDNQSFVALWPETGRTHQLRVHCASVLNAPIIGDTKYGNKLVNESIKTFLNSASSSLKLHLHARRIQFIHPFTNKPIDIIAPLPPSLKESWKKFGFNYKIDDNST
ncbi:hypothetical protein DICPUDRAFT_81306 [Dictyostelium purpureum]|uniref:Pseudouridine synthase RsuA/RluA-like domain-containing protein n=1 Tax=Dictyostelium purpureum TaxID=5786 RepID=F0ZT35_DICPU|nr:uncharacterized protein DICPUDRAFT_81306 [Dictyostelium purpureum]EGC32890.1 hypothetical protein DICPUDRAFT_81306 [Dictyostelium purpureum]|eukprot:XP_003290575.1 hypothetical protein DICPUDRAFT_81306 [Dictyostelium purpureum]